MNQKDLKRLRRRDLLEILLNLTKENALLWERMEEETKAKCMQMLSECKNRLGLYEKEDCE